MPAAIAAARHLARLRARVCGLGLFLLLLLVAGCAPAAGGDLAVGDTAVPLTVTMRQLRFQPETIRIPAGQEVTLLLDNLELLEHSLDIDALNIHIPLAGQEKETVTLPPLPPGTYDVYCGVAGHREAGMVGTLIVE